MAGLMGLERGQPRVDSSAAGQGSSDCGELPRCSDADDPHLMGFAKFPATRRRRIVDCGADGCRPRGLW